MILDQAADGVHIIFAMLIVGLIFLTVIGLGELTHWVNHRRHARKPSLPKY